MLLFTAVSVSRTKMPLFLPASLAFSVALAFWKRVSTGEMMPIRSPDDQRTG